MYLESDRIDHSQPYVKMITVNGQEHPCTVLPAGPQIHDEVVWAVSKKQNDQVRKREALGSYDGLGSLINYIRTKADQSDLED